MPAWLDALLCAAALTGAGYVMWRRIWGPAATGAGCAGCPRRCARPDRECAAAAAQPATAELVQLPPRRRPHVTLAEPRR